LAIRAITHLTLISPTAIEALEHPVFWSLEKRLDFLCCVGDEMDKLCDMENTSPDLQAFVAALRAESKKTNLMNGDWRQNVHEAVASNYERGIISLLRCIRNTQRHRETSPDVLRSVGRTPAEVASYFLHRFPQLLIVVWRTVLKHIDSLVKLQRFFPAKSATQVGH